MKEQHLAAINQSNSDELKSKPLLRPSLEGLVKLLAKIAVDDYLKEVDQEKLGLAATIDLRNR